MPEARHFSTEWHHKAVRGGWLPILSAVSRDLVHFAAVHAVGKAVPLNFSVLKDCLGNTKTPIMRALAELEGFGLLQRLPQDMTDKVNGYLAKRGMQTAEVIVQLKEPYQLKPAERWLLKEPKVRHVVSLLTRPDEIPDRERKEVRKRMETIKTSGSSHDSIWYGVYERLYRVLLERQKRPRTAIDFEKLIAFITPRSQEELEQINKELFSADSGDPSVNTIDWRELNSYEKKVIECYETFSGNKLRPDELELVREALRICYPSQITAGIRRYSGSIRDFEYLMTMIRKGAFGRRRPKQEESKVEERPIGKPVSTNEWDERRRMLREKAKRNKAENAVSK